MNGTVGSKAFRIGVSVVSSGGVTVVLLTLFRSTVSNRTGTMESGGSLAGLRRRRLYALVRLLKDDRSRPIKMRMYWIRGSLLDFGLSPSLDGPRG